MVEIWTSSSGKDGVMPLGLVSKRSWVRLFRCEAETLHLFIPLYLLDFSSLATNLFLEQKLFMQGNHYRKNLQK